MPRSLPGEEPHLVAESRAAIWRREGPAGDLGVVVLHSHPHMGGNMDDDRVLAVLRELHQRAAVAATLRFEFDKNLTANTDNVLEAIEILRAEDSVAQVALVGYSYGAACMCQVLCGSGQALVDAEKPLSAAAALALPVPMVLPMETGDPDWRPSVVLGRLSDAGLDLAFVGAACDQFCPEDELREWHARLGGRATLHIVPGADHFFSGPPWLREAVRAVADAVAGPADA